MKRSFPFPRNVAVAPTRLTVRLEQLKTPYGIDVKSVTFHFAHIQRHVLASEACKAAFWSDELSLLPYYWREPKRSWGVDRVDVQTHWEKIYTTKAPSELSWHSPHLETSIRLIEQAAAGYSARVIDVGGGESTLVDDLLARGYQDVTVL